MFSISANPAPTAKPRIAASTRKPIWRRVKRVDQHDRFSVSSVIGATYREKDANLSPVTSNSQAWSTSAAKAAAAPAGERAHEHRGRHELEAVDEHQRQQEHQDRQERDRDCRRHVPLLEDGQ